MSCFQPVSIARGRKLSDPRTSPTAGATHSFQLCISLSRRQTADHGRHLFRRGPCVRSVFGNGMGTRQGTLPSWLALACAACLHRCSRRRNFHYVIVNAAPLFSRLRRNHYPLFENHTSFHPLANLVIESGANRFCNHCSFSSRLNAPLIVPCRGPGPHKAAYGRKPVIHRIRAAKTLRMSNAQFGDRWAVR
jgi:hypothetical protein